MHALQASNNPPLLLDIIPDRCNECVKGLNFALDKRLESLNLDFRVGKIITAYQVLPIFRHTVWPLENGLLRPNFEGIEGKFQIF